RSTGGAPTPSYGRMRSRGDVLLAGVGKVGDGRASHVAGMAQVVEVGATVHGAAVVPDDEVADAPAMGVDEPRLGGEGHQAVHQRPTLGIVHAEDAADVRREVQAGT